MTFIKLTLHKTLKILNYKFRNNFTYFIIKASALNYLLISSLLCIKILDFVEFDYFLLKYVQILIINYLIIQL